MECPVVWLARRFLPLFSGRCLARTHDAHCAPEGSAAPGGRVVKRTGAAEALRLGEAVTLAGTDSAGDGEPLGAAPVAGSVADDAGGAPAGAAELALLPRVNTTVPATISVRTPTAPTIGHPSRTVVAFRVAFPCRATTRRYGSQATRSTHQRVI
jgi:hypothetical protein